MKFVIHALYFNTGGGEWYHYPTLLAASPQVQHPQVHWCLEDYYIVCYSRRARFEMAPGGLYVS